MIRSMRWLRRILVWTHRYLGIVLSALFFMWFLTGIGMIYSRGMPRLTPEVRLARLPALDLGQVHVTAEEAAKAAGIDGGRGRAALVTVLGRPAYRFSGRGVQTVFADNGEPFFEASTGQGKTIAAQFMGLPESRIRDAEVIDEPDQWTLTQTRDLPLYKYRAADAAATDLYVSPDRGEVVQLSTRKSRLLSWVSTIPHFLYFRSLRLKGTLWNNVVVWAAGLGCVLAAIGIILGILFFKRSRLPYAGWMRWHYISGLVFGLFTLTFAFSGLLSMEPWAWTTQDESLGQVTRDVFPSSAGDLSRYPAITAEVLAAAAGDTEVKEIEMAAILGEPHFIVRSASGLSPVPGPPDGGHQPYYVMRGVDPARWVIAAKDFAVRKHAFDASAIADRLKAAIPGVPLIDATSLSDYDSYYYSRDRQAPLPVLRIKLDDPDKTWLYIDTQIGQLVGRVNRLNRVERWLYNSLHTLDFSWLYYNRPLWDAVVILVSFGGATVSGIGLFLGIKRVVRGIRKTVLAGTAGLLLVVALVAALQRPASAHHSVSAEFDGRRHVSLAGTVTKVEWTNPHTFFYIDVKDLKTGMVTNWACELASPNGLAAMGWLPSTLRVGMFVSLTGTLARDGTRKVNARNIVADGKKLTAWPSEER
jgi:hypothetical protein